MLPMQESLDADNPSGDEFNDGLIVQDEFVLVQRAPQASFQGELFHRSGVDRGRIKANGPCILFRRVHGCVRALEESGHLVCRLLLEKKNNAASDKKVTT